jgi:hypothetical protein
MGKYCKGLYFSFLTALWFPAAGFAAGGGDVAPMVIVADTRKLSGIMKWWANVYNDNRIDFTLLTIVIIPLVGIVFGLLADIVMNRIGIDLEHRELAER